jgi:hypothetical protein
MQVNFPGFGSSVMVLEKASPLFDERGNRIGAFETVHNINEGNRILAGLNQVRLEPDTDP